MSCRAALARRRAGRSGKTRLATALAGRPTPTARVVLAGRCDEDLGVPFQPFVEALQHYVAHAADPRLGRFGGELARLVPEIADDVPGLAPPLRSDPETERYRLFDAVAAWLADVSAEAPVLLVLDDLQWAAKPTLLLLRHVLRSAEPLRLLVVATYRDSDLGRDNPLTEFLADLRRLDGVERLSLTGLDGAGGGRLHRGGRRAPPGGRRSGLPDGLARKPKATPSSSPRCCATWPRPAALNSGTGAGWSRGPRRRPRDPRGSPGGGRPAADPPLGARRTGP